MMYNCVLHYCKVRRGIEIDEMRMKPMQSVVIINERGVGEAIGTLITHLKKNPLVLDAAFLIHFSYTLFVSCVIVRVNLLRIFFLRYL